MKKQFLAMVLSGFLTSSAFANEFVTPVQEQYTNSYQSQANQYSDNLTAEEVQIVEKLVPIQVTQSKHYKYKTAPYSTYDYVNKISHSHGYKVFWQNGLSFNLAEQGLSDDFYKDSKVSWKSKVARAIQEYNENAFLYTENETALNAYSCDNDTIVISNPKNVSQLFNTYRASDCEVISNDEETKYFMNGKEVSPQEIQTLLPAQPETEVIQ